MDNKMFCLKAFKSSLGFGMMIAQSSIESNPMIFK